MTVKPIRIQLSRRKGFDLQALSIATNGLPAISVARPSLWGNPWKIGANYIALDGSAKRYTREQCIDRFRNWIEDNRTVECIKNQLRGKNLACWCKIISPSGYIPCHADVLLSLANELPMKEVVSENSRRAKGEAMR